MLTYGIFSHIYNVCRCKNTCKDANTYAYLFASPGHVAGVLTASRFTVGTGVAVGLLQELEQLQNSLLELESPQDL